MKARLLLARLAVASIGAAPGLMPAQTVNANFTNFIRQVQLPSGVQWDVSVASSGEQQSALEINPGGARFELYTVKNSPLTSYLLDSKYVGSFVPIGQVKIRTEDPYSAIPRTRADRPFWVDVTISGLYSGATDPAASKSVKLLRHGQSYGATGTGANLDRTQATLLSQATLSQNGTQTLSYVLTSVPGADRAKVRGEERFSVYSLADYQAPESQLASQFVQIWPVADGSISGLTAGQSLRFATPVVTLSANDLYPDSYTYAQIYPGAPQLGQTGAVVPGSSLVLHETVPQSRVLTLKNWDGAINADGQWTLEWVTSTPFGVDRLAFVTFTVDRGIRINGTVTSSE